VITSITGSWLAFALAPRDVATGYVAVKLINSYLNQESPLSNSIYVSEAKVATAAIEIQTLTVKNRKVTQALFKQIQVETLVNDDLTLNGVPWGWVNYLCDYAGDINVVWQKDNELRRCVIKEKLHINKHSDAYLTKLDDYDEAVRDFLNKMLNTTGREWRRGTGHRSSQNCPFADHEIYNSDTRLGLKNDWLNDKEHEVNLMARDLKETGSATEEDYDKLFSRYRVNLVEYLIKHFKDQKFQAKQDYFEGQRTEARYADLYSNLKSLPQLFIAM